MGRAPGCGADRVPARRNRDVLVLALGGAAYVLGRPTGIAFVLQVISALAVTAAGAWYLKRAIGGSRPSVGANSHRSIATAVGILPCPLTMLVLSAAFANATLGIGLMLVAVTGLGIMVTIGLVGSVGVAAQRGLSAGFGGEAPTLFSGAEVPRGRKLSRHPACRLELARCAIAEALSIDTHSRQTAWPFAR